MSVVLAVFGIVGSIAPAVALFAAALWFRSDRKRRREEHNRKIDAIFADADMRMAQSHEIWRRWAQEHFSPENFAEWERRCPPPRLMLDRIPATK